MYPCQVKPAELQLGDVVSTFSLPAEPYDDATVVRIDNGRVYLFRPYVHTSDFSMIGNQITPYVGFEQYSLWIDSEREVTLKDRRLVPIH